MPSRSLVASGPATRPGLVTHLAVAAAAVIFGSTFVVVKHAIRHARPVPFLAARFGLAALVLAAVDVLRSRRRAAAEPSVGPPDSRFALLAAGGLAGLALLGGYVFQTVGLQYTSTSVSAFITYLLVVLVPVLGAIVYRRWPTPTTAAGVVLATIGLALLTGKGLALGKGEVLTLGCAVCFAAHILVLADAAPRFDALRLNAVQLAVVGAACLLPALWLGGFDFGLAGWMAAAYTAVMASAVALGLQIYGQQELGPARTAILLMIEPVAAAVFGVFTGEHLGAVALVGASLILLGIAVSEVGPVVLGWLPAEAGAERD
jgi:drug/metabolite transporter (DMT)-like permease